jgi:hypothetical protein
MRHVNIVSQDQFVMRADVERLTESFKLIKEMDDSHSFIDGSELEIPRNDKYAINLLLLSGGQPLKIETDFDGFNYFETATFLDTNHELLVAILNAMPYTDLGVLMKNWYRIKLFPEAKSYEQFVLRLAPEEVDISPYVDYLVDFSFPTQFDLRMTHGISVADFITKITPEDIFYGRFEYLYKMNKHFRDFYAATDARAYIPAKAVKDIMWIFIYGNAEHTGETEHDIYYLKPVDIKDDPLILGQGNFYDFNANNNISSATDFSRMYQLQKHIIRPAPEFDSGEGNPIIFIDNEGNYYITTRVSPHLLFGPYERVITSIEGELEAYPAIVHPQPALPLTYVPVWH